MTGFVAKEVVVGSSAQSYAVAAPDHPARAGSRGADRAAGALVQAVLDDAERLGVVAVAGRGYGSGCPTGPERASIGAHDSERKRVDSKTAARSWPSPGCWSPSSLS